MLLKRYLRLLLSFFRYSLMAETEFRSNLVFYSITNLLWLGLAVLGIELIFGYVDSIANWDKNQIYLVLILTKLFGDVCWTLIYRNLGAFSSWIRRGELDYKLLLPVNTRFILSFKILEFDHYLRIAIELFLIYKFTILITGSFSIINAFLALFLFTCAFFIFYSLFFAITVTNIWFINLANLIDFFENIEGLGDKPTYIYQKGLFLFFSFVLPVAFIATFPAEVLMGRIVPSKFIIASVLAVILLVGSNMFFKFALKHYSSASR